ncbi:MAG: hypothetical protein AAFQ76_11620, partial [Cyanobacteria bacterium J06626_26]
MKRSLSGLNLLLLLAVGYLITPQSALGQTAANKAEDTINLAQAEEQSDEAEDGESLRIVVTGEENRYVVPNATTGTRTDTPLRDIPQSIQVIPQEVLEDQRVI